MVSPLEREQQLKRELNRPGRNIQEMRQATLDLISFNSLCLQAKTQYPRPPHLLDEHQVDLDPGDWIFETEMDVEMHPFCIQAYYVYLDATNYTFGYADQMNMYSLRVSLGDNIVVADEHGRQAALTAEALTALTTLRNELPNFRTFILDLARRALIPERDQGARERFIDFVKYYCATQQFYKNLVREIPADQRTAENINRRYEDARPTFAGFERQIADFVAFRNQFEIVRNILGNIEMERPIERYQRRVRILNEEYPQVNDGNAIQYLLAKDRLTSEYLVGSSLEADTRHQEIRNDINVLRNDINVLRNDINILSGRMDQMNANILLLLQANGIAPPQE